MQHNLLHLPDILTDFAEKIYVQMRISDLFFRGSFNVQFGRYIKLFRHIRSVFLPLSDAFCQKIFNLPVHRAEIILCPGCNCVIKLPGKTERNLFFGVVCHIRISKGYRYLRLAVHRDFRTALPSDLKPLQLCVLHPGLQSGCYSDVPAPFPPCRLLRPQSSFWRR